MDKEPLRRGRLAGRRDLAKNGHYRSDTNSRLEHRRPIRSELEFFRSARSTGTAIAKAHCEKSRRVGPVAMLLYEKDPPTGTANPPTEMLELRAMIGIVGRLATTLRDLCQSQIVFHEDTSDEYRELVKRAIK